MTKNWYFEHDGKDFGPFTADELRQKASEGHLHPNDLVWREGMSQHVEAQFVPTLFEPHSAGSESY